MGRTNSYPNSQDNFIITIFGVYKVLFFVTLGKSCNLNLILNVTYFTINPNRKCKEWKRLFGKSQERVCWNHKGLKCRVQIEPRKSV